MQKYICIFRCYCGYKITGKGKLHWLNARGCTGAAYYSILHGIEN